MSHNKYISISDILTKFKKFKKNKKKIIFTNGCFDILHSGHIRLLIKSKKKGDILVVGLNSDQSYFKIKKKKPKIKFLERVKILSEINSVNYILKLNDKDPMQLIKKLKPYLHCKGGDYIRKNLIEYELLKKLKIKLFIMPIKEKKISSSDIIL